MTTKAVVKSLVRLASGFDENKDKDSSHSLRFHKFYIVTMVAQHS
jgi:hypothetical protein